MHNAETGWEWCEIQIPPTSQSQATTVPSISLKMLSTWDGYSCNSSLGNAVRAMVVVSNLGMDYTDYTLSLLTTSLSQKPPCNCDMDHGTLVCFLSMPPVHLWLFLVQPFASKALTLFAELGWDLAVWAPTFAPGFTSKSQVCSPLRADRTYQHCREPAAKTILQIGFFSKQWSPSHSPTLSTLSTPWPWQGSSHAWSSCKNRTHPP